MFRLNYKIYAKSPLIISSNSGDPNMVSTLDYIPGTYIRGIIANAYINTRNLNYENAHKDEGFFNLFLKGDIIFSNAYITDDSVAQYLPIPLSIQQEKNSKSNLFNLMDRINFDVDTKSINGYGKIDGESVLIRKVKTILNFHHSRDRERGVSKTGLIFNYESIKEGQSFLGTIIGSRESLEKIRELIDKKEFFIGRSKNNQYGTVKLGVISIEEYNHDKFGNNFPIDVVITLSSDAILYNEFGYSVIDIAELEKIIGFKIKKAFVRDRDEEGFSAVWKLKRPSEVAFKGGSSFLIEVKDEMELNKLYELQKKGIGIRTNEGFGRFNISPVSKIQRGDEYKENIHKPSNPMPQVLKENIIGIMKEHMLKKVQLNAIKDVSSFRNYKSIPKSLIARLEVSVREGKMQEVIQNIENKRIAREHLEECRNNNQSLLDFLKDKLANYKMDKSDYSEFEELRVDMDDCLMELMQDNAFSEELKRTYLSTFLLFMRKRIKSGG